MMNRCQNCGEQNHQQCDLSHPHCYFRCGGPERLYVREYKSPKFGWTKQILSICLAHQDTLGDRWSGGEREIYKHVTSSELTAESTEAVLKWGKPLSFLESRGGQYYAVSEDGDSIEVFLETGAS